MGAVILFCRGSSMWDWGKQFQGKTSCEGLGKCESSAHPGEHQKPPLLRTSPCWPSQGDTGLALL